jgi:hypothetical protein
MEKLLDITVNPLYKTNNPIGKTEKCARNNWKIRSVKMENPLSDSVKSAQ